MNRVPLAAVLVLSLTWVGFAKAPTPQGRGAGDLPSPAPAPGGAVTGISAVVHSVSDLDKTLAFYRDLFGLESPEVPKAPSANPVEQRLTNSPPVQVRRGRLTLPGLGFDLELVEYRGADRQLVKPAHADAGSATVGLRVRDVDQVLGLAKKAGADIITLRGEPVRLGPAGTTQSVFVRDPDGFKLEVISGTPSAQSPAGMVIGGDLALTIASTEKSLTFYRDLLGFELRGNPAFSGNRTIMDMIGIAGDGQVRSTAGTIPGSTARFNLFEFRVTIGPPFRPRIQDPGAVSLVLRVADLESLVTRMKAASVRIITVGGTPIQVNGTRRIVVEDPDGVPVQLVQETGWTPSSP